MSVGTRIAARLVQLGFLVGLLLLWHLVTVNGAVNALILPKLDRVWFAFVDIVTTGAFWPDLKVTITELVIAFSIALVLGSTIGYAVSRTRFAVRVFDPFFAGIYSIPAILFFPLYVMFFGLGPPSKIAIGATIAFFPIVLNTIAGFANVNPIYIRAAHSMGASDRQLFLNVLMPAAFPVIVTGLRMGFILAFLSILGTETITSLAGLGHRIATQAEAMNMPEMYGYIVLVVIIAALLNWSVNQLERRGKRF